MAYESPSDFFASRKDEVIYYLLFLDGKQRSNALGITEELYEDYTQAQAWYNDLVRLVHPDNGGDLRAFRKLRELYECMIDDLPDPTPALVEPEPMAAVKPVDIYMQNANGVFMDHTMKYGHHHKAANAVCCCGCPLILAPPIFEANHKPNNPVLACEDHGVHAYYFQDLVIGKQPKPEELYRDR